MPRGRFSHAPLLQAIRALTADPKITRQSLLFAPLDAEQRGECGKADGQPIIQ
jgi:hypothetical protein